MNTLFGLEYFQRPLKSLLLELSPSWVMHDPFGVYWHPEREENPEGLYETNEALEAIEANYDWLDSVVLFDGSSLNRDVLRTVKKRHGYPPPDWARRYDFFLDNHLRLSECADIVVFPKLWLSDNAHGNAVLFCRRPKLLQTICTGAVLLPIAPEAVLASWPRDMLDYMEAKESPGKTFGNRS